MHCRAYLRAISVIFYLSTGFVAGAGPAHAGYCPALGDDADCGAVITITDSGSSISFTGQGPYDGGDDTLVGVVNKSSQAIYAMGLRSSAGIFGFDGDGIVPYGAPGNSHDVTGYGGPNSYYSDISGDARSGVVNFVNPLSSNGGSTYFSLEEALTKPTAIQDIVNNSISVSLGGRFGGTAFGLLNLFRPTNITGTFTPNGGLTLGQAEQQTGFTDFQWQQTITNLPGVSPFYQVGNTTPLTAPPPFVDAPKGGYTYCLKPGYEACLTSFPFYPFQNNTGASLSMYDSPGDPFLPAGTAIEFKTELLGVLPGFVAGTDCLGASVQTCVDLGVGFTWKSSYNGTYGGISTTANNQQVDPNTADGLGGASVTSIQEITTYSPFDVTTVNGNPVTMLPPPAVPEPATYAMMIGGMLIIGSAMRRRSGGLGHAS